MPRVDGFSYNTYPGIPSGIETVSLSDSKSYIGVQGFIPNISGTLAIEMVDGSTGTMVVVSGLQYAGNVNKFKSTGSSGVTSVTVFY